MDLATWLDRQGIARQTKTIDGFIEALDVLMRHLAFSASVDGYRVLNVYAVADRLREDVELVLARSFPSTAACRQWFHRAVKRLAEYGAIDITRKLEKNVKRHVYVGVELKGQILVHPDLRAPVHHDRTVRDIEEGR